MAHPCSVSSVAVPLKNGTCLKIFAEKGADQDSLLELEPDDALESGEELFQLMEGCGYEYELPPGFEILRESEIIRPSRIRRNCGRLEPNIYVGRLCLTVLKDEDVFDKVAVEVRSIKADYRSEYRTMLEDITARCVELLMAHSSPVTQRFTVDHNTSSKTVYQRFAFVKSIVDSDEFRNAIHRITAMPVTGWKHTLEERDIRRAGRITSSQLRQIASKSDRINLSDDHPLHRIGSVPARLTAISKTDTVDIPENRFVKHALQVFQNFCAAVCDHIEHKGLEKQPVFAEAKALEDRLGEYLSHSVFRELSRPHTLPLNSPVLQRKEGYREILHVWLMFDLAAKLCWNALDDDQYHAGKRDVATLYEYWVFFKLLDVLNAVFSINPKETEKLIQPTKDGMGLQLRQGRHVALSGECAMNGRKLNIRFHYNRTFGKSDYPGAGSWTQQMRPDYTLSVWPKDFSESEAEKQELIVHIHFDAKYKVDGLKYLINGSLSQAEPDDFDSLTEDEQDKWLEKANAEKTEQKEGTYTRADLLKMHAYKDAIRRTGGAYILYPGSVQYRREGFHEIIPGLGAFPVSPSATDSGTEELSKFIVAVVQNLTNRASHREELSYYTYDVNRDKPDGSAVYEPLPEKYGAIRSRPLNRTTVLVGYYQTEQYDWIKESRLYNIRLDKKGGLEKYGAAETGAVYLLLHGSGNLVSGDLWKITGAAPTPMTKDELVAKKYPKAPSRDNYLVYEIEPVAAPEFAGSKWDIRLLRKTSGYGYTIPFAVSMAEFMKAKVHSDS